MFQLQRLFSVEKIGNMVMTAE